MSADRSHRIERRSHSAEETAAVATAVAKRLEQGATICLSGPLGSGKSVVARGLCRGLGVDEGVLSPTFLLVEEYAGRLSVIHCDLYRLNHEQEVEDLGLFDRLGDGSVLIVEWGERSERLLAAADMVIGLGVTGERDRVITIEATVEFSERLGGI